MSNRILKSIVRRIFKTSPETRKYFESLVRLPIEEQTSYVLSGDFDLSPHGKCLRNSFFSALALETKLPKDLVTMPGMSGRKYRYLINHLVSALPAPRYLEVGSWRGSTLCAAIYGNGAQAVAIDNWSEFGGPKEAFLANVDRYAVDKSRIRIIESDFRKADWASLPPSNIYLFDGPHSETDQYDGITYAQPALDDTFILIVDDYNWPQVRTGTLRAIEALDLHVECSIEVRTTTDDSCPGTFVHENSDWHNGYFIAVMNKSSR